MRLIPLTQGFYAVEEDFEDLIRFSWSINHGYARRYWIDKVSGKVLGEMMHRRILRLTSNDGLAVDHINGHRRDNRRCNLRLASNSENQANQTRRPRGSSQCVSFERERNCWKAQITVLGRFPDDVTAALAYDEAAQRFFGEFARPNFSTVQP